MSLIYRDRVRQRIAATGASSLPLSSPIASYKAFGDADLGSNSFPYAIVNELQYEVGIGSFISAAASSTSYGVLNRNQVLDNYQGGTGLVNFSGSPAEAFITNASSVSVLTSTVPAGIKKIIKWDGAEYDLIDPVFDAPSLGTSINNSVIFYDAATTDFKADQDMTFTPGNTPEFFVNGVVQATAKAFVIPHPLKRGLHLQHGSLEGPEFGIYQRGVVKTHWKAEILLPDYFRRLCVSDSISLVCSSDSFIPMKSFVDYGMLHINLLFPSLKPVTIHWMATASRNDVVFKLEI